MQLAVVTHDEALQEALVALAKDGKRVALVPTMGALHAGHISLVELARQQADAVVVSIFVNPTQFGPNEDFAKYPRTLEEDCKKLEAAGATLVYAPDAKDLYPEGFSSSITVGNLSKILCGKFRPGHFDGVATVVAKLLLRTLPHVAIFGEKDYQQLSVIRRMVADLDIPVEIVGAPIMREADGLAMSSRNRYLDKAERKAAAKLYSVLQQTASRVTGGEMSVAAALEDGRSMLEGYGFKLDYVSLCDADSLEEISTLETPARLLVAAWLGKTRLIDNLSIAELEE